MFRKTNVLIVMIISFSLITISFAQSDQISIPDKSYFGQKPPGIIPEIFAQGIISDAGYRLHGVPVFSLEGNEVFWPVIPPAIMYMKLIPDSGWTEPKNKQIEGRMVGATFFSQDGKNLYYHAFHPDGFGSTDIWYMKKENDDWSESVNLGSPPNSESMETQPSFTIKGDLYYCGKLDSVGFNRGIYYSANNNGKYSEAILLNNKINSPAIDYTPFISPDGSYLLFSSSRPGVKESDLKLYVSFLDNGEWSEPYILSDIFDLKYSARFPALSIDGKYLFFLSGGNVYWVSASVIDELKKNIDK